jgi:putative aminopeptidase FrvX
VSIDYSVLKELTELNGVSGNEDDVRDYILSKIKDLADEIKIDTMGNMIAIKKGKSTRFKIMLSAHMDEVGFMVTGYGESGTLKFKMVGGMDSRILLGKKVLVGEKKIPGVIGCKPIHLQERDERRSNIKFKSMYIDIGAEKRDEAEKLAPKGEYVSFISEYLELGGDCIKAKALDDRVGCAVLMEMLKGTYDFDLYACFTVQEEVGLRGSETAAYYVNPDLAFVLEGTTCSDVPGVEKYDYSTILGGGAALTIMDRTTYAAKNLVDFIYKTAKAKNIAVQYKQTTTGGNDAGKIQKAHSGVKVASISAPCRYIHSPVSVMNMNDFESCVKVTGTVLEELSKDQNLIEVLKNGGYINV